MEENVVANDWAINIIDYRVHMHNIIIASSAERTRCKCHYCLNSLCIIATCRIKVNKRKSE